MGKHIGTGGLAWGKILGRLAFYTWVAWAWVGATRYYSGWVGGWLGGCRRTGYTLQLNHFILQLSVAQMQCGQMLTGQTYL